MLLELYLLSVAFGIAQCQDCAEHTVTDGLVSPTGTITNGASATITCNEGYVITGTMTTVSITCTSGVYDSTPSCTRIDCDTPTKPGYTFDLPDPDSQYGSTVGIQNCATGFTGSPVPDSLSCEASGSWTIVTGCTRKVIGSACTADGDECSLIVNGECGSSDTCACQTGYTGNNGDDSCTAAVGAVCTTNGNECDSVGHTECGNGMTCSCVSGYKGTVGDASCTEAVGAVCTTDGNECDSVGHTECGSGLTCSCVSGYRGAVGDASCTEAVGAACTLNGNECDSVGHTECGSGLTCSCVSGYIGTDGDASCTEAVGATCTTNGNECDSVGHTECGSGMTCSCLNGYKGIVGDASCTEESYEANEVDAYRCAVFEQIEGPCASGSECIVDGSEAQCRPIEEPDNIRLIIGVGVGVPLGLIAVVFIVVVCIYVNRKTRRSDRSSDSESYDDDRHRFPSKIATRYTGGYGQSPAAVYGPQYFESFSEPALSSRQPAGPGEQPIDTNFSWDFLYDQYPPGKKFEIRRPKY